MSAPILLSAVGSSGDVFPVLALARALEAQGQPVRIALSPEEADKARAAGLDAFAAGPSEAEVIETLGLDRDGLARQVFRNPSPILRRATYPMLADLARRLVPEAERARATCGTLLAMAAPLAAEMTGTPYVDLALQPMVLRSALDPPRITGFAPPMVRDPGNPTTRAWNRAWLKVIDAEFRRRHARAQSRVRRALGLPASNAVPLFCHAKPPLATLGLWDPAFSPCPPDRGAILTGFPKPAAPPLPEALTAFLDAGPPPLVVTLGSVSHRLAGPRFWHEAAALARRHSLRAVLLAGGAETPTGPDLHTADYAAHDLLFPRACVILHHGGIGTTGAALRSGRPQLVLPLGADQPDHAERLEAQGLARRIRRPESADEALAAMLTADAKKAATALAARLIPDGATRAAETLLDLLKSPRPLHPARNTPG